MSCLQCSLLKHRLGVLSRKFRCLGLLLLENLRGLLLSHDLLLQLVLMLELKLVLLLLQVGRDI